MHNSEDRTGRITHFAHPEERIKSADGIGNSFTKQEVKLQDTPLFFPEGFENIFLAVYFVSLPYILGLLFLFFYIADGKFNVFASVNKESPFIVTWAIGYEILAVLMILWVVKSAITFTKNHTKSNNLHKLH